jgi:hypothetical protein
MDLKDNLERPERRKEDRLPQSGAIEISFEDPNPVMIRADLIEISDQGFRATHDSKALAPGLEIQYAREGSSGTARVIWTHVLEGRCVSGFLILAAR